MYFIIYEKKKFLNNKIYRGAHSCKFLDDGYLGSGKLLKEAIKKYGTQNFKRVILEYCDSVEHMYEREKWWVDEEFVKRDDS